MSGEVAGVVEVEVGAEVDQLAHECRALGDEHPHGRFVAQSGARHQGVGEVLIG